VEWFNQVDATYRSDLRELNELNFARFDAKLEQRVAELDSKLEQRLAQFEAKLEQRTAELRAEFQHGIAALDSKLERRITELIKWMFVFWIGTVGPLAGLIIALSR
jgi:DNA anti-recombination protein RmuC